ncbi:hypothetical protein RF11_11718 [Thelohanellus kitauei]|uniref:Uncharacterized protein n=1 Tax=Thelohanellus kitauei TaxID=669202 RepID=A0A0C2MZL8_THEKT|nr:hypothetical protein RF11_11718 [Thelohanellus kitauei]
MKKVKLFSWLLCFLNKKIVFRKEHLSQEREHIFEHLRRVLDKNLNVPLTPEVDLHCHQSQAQIFYDKMPDFHWILCFLNHDPNSKNQRSIYLARESDSGYWIHSNTRRSDDSTILSPYVSELRRIRASYLRKGKASCRLTLSIVRYAGNISRLIDLLVRDPSLKTSIFDYGWQSFNKDNQTCNQAPTEPKLANKSLDSCQPATGNQSTIITWAPLRLSNACFNLRYHLGSSATGRRYRQKECRITLRSRYDKLPAVEKLNESICNLINLD